MIKSLPLRVTISHVNNKYASIYFSLKVGLLKTEQLGEVLCVPSSPDALVRAADQHVAVAGLVQLLT